MCILACHSSFAHFVTHAIDAEDSRMTCIRIPAFLPVANNILRACSFMSMSCLSDNSCAILAGVLNIRTLLSFFGSSTLRLCVISVMVEYNAVECRLG